MHSWLCRPRGLCGNDSAPWKDSSHDSVQSGRRGRGTWCRDTAVNVASLTRSTGAGPLASGRRGARALGLRGSSAGGYTAGASPAGSDLQRAQHGVASWERGPWRAMCIHIHQRSPSYGNAPQQRKVLVGVHRAGGAADNSHVPSAVNPKLYG